MNITPFGEVRFIRAAKIIARPTAVPDQSGVYFVFLKGGEALLRAGAYEAFAGPRLRTVAGHQLVYVGAARNLRARLAQNLCSDVTSSSLRRTLLALQLQLGAISASRTIRCNVEGERSLTRWLSENGLFGITLHEQPFFRERQIISQVCCPFNIVHRRADRYARFLSVLRQAAFPVNAPRKYRCLRNV